MTIEWKDPNMRLHGKRHKRDRYYFRWHYGKQRMVQMSGEYVDKPTERQISAREAFTALRREVARQLRDAELRAEWLRRFEADNEGYKMLHTYVYAKMKASPLQLPPQGESCVAETTKTTKATRATRATEVTEVTEVTETTMTSTRRGNALVSTSRTEQKFRSAEARRFGRGDVVDERDTINGFSTPYAGSKLSILVVHNGGIVPLFLPWKVGKREYWQIE